MEDGSDPTGERPTLNNQFLYICIYVKHLEKFHSVFEYHLTSMNLPPRKEEGSYA
jgi:hypothetical protein